MIHRRSPYSKVFVLKEVAPGVSLFIPQTEDLNEELLQNHYNKAIEDENYEYASFIITEAKRRSLNLIYTGDE